MACPRKRLIPNFFFFPGSLFPNIAHRMLANLEKWIFVHIQIGEA